MKNAKTWDWKNWKNWKKKFRHRQWLKIMEIIKKYLKNIWKKLRTEKFQIASVANFIPETQMNKISVFVFNPNEFIVGPRPALHFFQNWKKKKKREEIFSITRNFRKFAQENFRSRKKTNCNEEKIVQKSANCEKKIKKRIKKQIEESRFNPNITYEMFLLWIILGVAIASSDLVFASAFGPKVLRRTAIRILRKTRIFSRKSPSFWGWWFLFPVAPWLPGWWPRRSKLRIESSRNRVSLGKLGFDENSSRWAKKELSLWASSLKYLFNEHLLPEFVKKFLSDRNRKKM